MAEEQRCQIESHILCANNCGFFGSTATNNLCSKCYRDLRLKHDQAESAKLAVEKSLSTSSSSAAVTSPKVDVAAVPSPPVPEQAVTPPQPAQQSNNNNRCGGCKRKVGLTGFRCKCGVTFCGAHRYPEKHDCSFDYKGKGKDEIARANPVVKAAKLDKI